MTWTEEFAHFVFCFQIMILQNKDWNDTIDGWRSHQEGILAVG